MSATASSPGKDTSSPSNEVGSSAAPPPIVVPKPNPDEQTVKTAPDERKGREENLGGDTSSSSNEVGSTPAPPPIVVPKPNPDEQTEKIAPDEREGGEENQGGEAEEEEQGECGFCLFMKGGGCRDSFIAWEKCIEDAEKNNEDIVNKCHQATALLKTCMEAHSDYYEPVLRVEKAAEEQAKKEIEEEASLAAAEGSAPTAGPALVPPPAPYAAPAQSEGKLKGRGTDLNARYLPTLFKCSFSNLSRVKQTENCQSDSDSRPSQVMIMQDLHCIPLFYSIYYLKKFHMPRLMIFKQATTVVSVFLCIKVNLKSNTVWIQANLSTTFSAYKISREQLDYKRRNIPWLQSIHFFESQGVYLSTIDSWSHVAEDLSLNH